jgi:hypothetical protein
VALIVRSSRLGLAGFTFVSLAFFVGNWVWMTATVGPFYQNAPQPLCVNYLIGTQLSAGEGWSRPRLPSPVSGECMRCRRSSI